LLSRELNTKADFEKWLEDRSELDAVLEEDMAWRYIRMSIDTTNETFSAAYNLFITKIQPELAPLDDQLNRKLVDCSFKNEFNTDEAYKIYFRATEVQLNLFKEENVAIEAELNEKAQQYGAISAAQSIEHKGENLTIQKAAQLLKEQDENLRKEVFEKIANRRREDSEKLDELYTELIKKRHELALNAGFENFVDYKFQALGRFDYSK
jgi:oligoendopeptidase F